MQSTVQTVDAYLEQIPTERRAALTKLRELCLEILRGYEEVMEYGMPVYKRNGTGEVAFASQKNYISLYILKQDALTAHLPLLAGLNVGKSCIRYSKPEKMNFAVIETLLRTTVQSDSPVC
ncbi:MAG: DUF1801 domain-containing protein [Anaerolineales bacterium]